MGTPPFTVWANYSLNSEAGPWTPIDTIQGRVLPSKGSYEDNWLLPLANSTKCRVKIETVDSRMFRGDDLSDSDFSIDSGPPSVNWTIPPNNSKNVSTAAPVVIKFSEKMEPNSTISAFKITPDPGGWLWYWNADGDQLTGTHNQMMPLTNYNCTIETGAMDDFGKHLISEYKWNFTTGAIPIAYITNPSTGDELFMLSEYNVTWTINKGKPPYSIWLNYSTDGGLTYNPVPSVQGYNQSSSGIARAVWITPNVFTRNATLNITVYDNLGQRYNGMMNGTFSIVPPKITLKSPNGGELLTAGEIFNITWDWECAAHHSTFVTLKYMVGGKSGTKFIIADHVPNTGSYGWTVPDIASENCYVNITLTDNTTATSTQGFDESDSNFTIRLQPISAILLNPNGGENLTAGTVCNVVWDTTGGNGTKKSRLEFSNDAGVTWNMIANNINGTSYDWTLPNFSATETNCMVRVTVWDSASPPSQHSDVSDAVFTIYVPPPPKLSITLTSPAGGEVWNTGTVQNITWSISGTPPYSSVLIEYSTTGPSGTFTKITDSATATDGSYPWTIPDIPQTSVNCFVRVTVTDGTSQTAKFVNGQSFTIAAPNPPKITLLYPNGGEKLRVGETCTIRWNVTGGVAPVLVDLSYTTSGSSGTYSPISINVDASVGSYNWTVPDAQSTNCFVKAVASDNFAGGRTDWDTSDGKFSITQQVQPLALSVISPAGGSKISGGSDYAIKWSRTGGTAPYTTRIYYSLDDGANYIAISENATDSGESGTHTWAVPDVSSSQCRIKINVTDGEGSAADSFSGLFEIVRSGLSGENGGIDGYVEYENGKAAVNSTVSVIGRQFTVKTDENGYFRITDIPEGTYSILISKEGYESIRKDGIVVEKGKITRVDTVRLKAAGVSGTEWLVIAGIGIAVIAIVVLLLLYMVIMKRKRRKEMEARKASFVYPSAVSSTASYTSSSSSMSSPQASGTYAPPSSARDIQTTASVGSSSSQASAHPSFHASSQTPSLSSHQPYDTASSTEQNSPDVSGDYGGPAYEEVPEPSMQPVPTEQHPEQIQGSYDTASVEEQKQPNYTEPAQTPQSHSDEAQYVQPENMHPEKESHLRTLDNMRAQGLISEEVYYEKRRKLMEMQQ